MLLPTDVSSALILLIVAIAAWINIHTAAKRADLDRMAARLRKEVNRVATRNELHAHRLHELESAEQKCRGELAALKERLAVAATPAPCPAPNPEPKSGS